LAREILGLEKPAIAGTRMETPSKPEIAGTRMERSGEKAPVVEEDKSWGRFLRPNGDKAPVIEETEIKRKEKLPYEKPKQKIGNGLAYNRGARVIILIFLVLAGALIFILFEYSRYMDGLRR
jgi:hypothetical protein